MYLHPQFQTDVIKPLRIDELMDQEVQHLSGGELQRVAITMCLGKEADLYLIDEPSAYLDSEQRIIAAKVCTAVASCDLSTCVPAPQIVGGCFGLKGWFWAVLVCTAQMLGVGLHAGSDSMDMHKHAQATALLQLAVPQVLKLWG